MRYPLCLLATVALAFAAEPATPPAPAAKPAEAAPAGTPLFNGKDFSGWEFTATPAPNPPADINKVLHYADDGVLAAAGKPTGFLATTATYDKGYRLHVEWRFVQKTGTPNGGVLLHISSGPKNNTAWPLSFQVQTKTKFAGDLLPMSGGTFAEPLTSAPGASVPIKGHTAPDSEKPLGEWNSADIVCRADTIEVTVNGVLQNKISKAVPATGKIGFQFEGYPFEMRNVRLSPLE